MNAIANQIPNLNHFLSHYGVDNSFSRPYTVHTLTNLEENTMPNTTIHFHEITDISSVIKKLGKDEGAFHVNVITFKDSNGQNVTLNLYGKMQGQSDEVQIPVANVEICNT